MKKRHGAGPVIREQYTISVRTFAGKNSSKIQRDTQNWHDLSISVLIYLAEMNRILLGSGYLTDFCI
jgi:hypothetical protein